MRGPSTLGSQPKRLSEVPVFILFACLLSLGLLLYLVRAALFLVQVSGRSMYPTLKEGDLILALRFWPPRWLRRGQIVVWQFASELPAAGAPPSVPSDLFIKRVTGLPGDQVTVACLRSPTSQVTTIAPDGDTEFQTWSIPPNHCFLQGDAPGLDSRLIGPVPTSSLCGLFLLKLRSVAALRPESNAKTVYSHTNVPGDP